MTNKDRAARGALAYSAVRHDDNDPITNIYDLVADLFHYADTFSGRVPGFENEPRRERIGAYVADMATRHYKAEVSEEVTDPLSLLQFAQEQVARVIDRHGALEIGADTDDQPVFSLEIAMSFLDEVEKILEGEELIGG